MPVDVRNRVHGGDVVSRRRAHRRREAIAFAKREINRLGVQRNRMRYFVEMRMKETREYGNSSFDSV